MDLDFVRKVIEILEESKVDELEVEMGEMRVRVKKSGTPALPAFSAAMPMAPLPTLLPASSAGGGPTIEEAGVKQITAPMVGTFYRAPAPDAPPYVQAGDVVDEGTVVCILEAMKVMNEIKAEVSGTVIEILVENGMPVEFGQPLFRIRTL